MKVEPDRAEQEHLLASLLDLLGLVLYVRVNNLSVMSGWVYLGGSSTKQRVKCLFALMFFAPVNHFESCRLLVLLFYTIYRCLH